MSFWPKYILCEELSEELAVVEGLAKLVGVRPKPAVIVMYGEPGSEPEEETIGGVVHRLCSMFDYTNSESFFQMVGGKEEGHSWVAMCFDTYTGSDYWVLMVNRDDVPWWKEKLNRLADEELEKDPDTFNIWGRQIRVYAEDPGGKV